MQGILLLNLKYYTTSTTPRRGYKAYPLEFPLHAPDFFWQMTPFSKALPNALQFRITGSLFLIHYPNLLTITLVIPDDPKKTEQYPTVFPSLQHHYTKKPAPCVLEKEVPNIKMWFSDHIHSLHLERIRYTLLDKPEYFNMVWAPCINFLSHST